MLVGKRAAFLVTDVRVFVAQIVRTIVVTCLREILITERDFLASRFTCYATAI